MPLTLDSSISAIPICDDTSGQAFVGMREILEGNKRTKVEKHLAPWCAHSQQYLGPIVNTNAEIVYAPCFGFNLYFTITFELMLNMSASLLAP